MDWCVRDMKAEDLADVERIFGARMSPDPVPESVCRARDGEPAVDRRSQHWQRLARIEEVLAADRNSALALVGICPRGRVLGYIVGAVGSWEFGSEPTGWIFALGVDPSTQGQGLGQRLLACAVQRFRTLGIRTVRTMVRRDDVAVLRFFRSGHFKAGPYVELELSLRTRG